MSDQIRFLCPTCRAVMEAPVAQAGNKINCLKCGQRLQIPSVERAKTILAPMVAMPAKPAGQPAAAGTPVATQAAAAAIPVARYANPSAPAPAKPRRRRGCLLTAIMLFAAGLIGTACLVPLAWYGWTVSNGTPKVDLAEQRKDSRLPEELLVKKYILDYTNDPKSVEFDRWGPHVLKNACWGEFSEILAHDAEESRNLALIISDRESPPYIVATRQKKPAKLIRVFYRGNNALGAKVAADQIYVIQDNKVVYALVNIWGGDDWTRPLKDKAPKEKPAAADNAKRMVPADEELPAHAESRVAPEMLLQSRQHQRSVPEAFLF
jgi:hypothetical protein